MKYKTKKTYVTAVISAMAAFGLSSIANAAVVPSAANSATSFADSADFLDQSIADRAVPAQITTAIANLQQVKTDQTAILNAANVNVATFEAQYQAAIASFDAGAAATALAAKTVAQGDAALAQNKINLVDDAIFSPTTGGVALADAAASAAATAAKTEIKAVVDAYTGGTKVAGLQSVIDSAQTLTTVDVAAAQAASLAAGTSAATATTDFQASGQDFAAIAAYANSTKAALLALPAIDVDYKTPILDTVLNGSWERQAIATNTADIATNAAAIATETTDRTAADVVHTADIATNAAAIATETTDRTSADVVHTTGIAANTAAIAQEVTDRTALIRQEADGSIHIGANSLITQEVGGVQQLYAQDAGANPININVTNGSDLLVNGVSVATDADVAAETTRATTAEATLQSNINAEAVTRGNADAALQTNINNEAATRAAADVVLQTNINNEASTRAAADVVLQSNIANEAATRSNEDSLIRASIQTEASTRAAADSALGQRIDTEAVTRANADVVLNDRIDGVAGRVGRAERDISKLRRGVAMAAALQTPVIAEGHNNALKVGVAAFDGETGLAAGYARKLNDSVTVNAEVATTSDFDETIVRGGANYSW